MNELIDKAKAQPRDEYTIDEIELAVSWFNGEITTKQGGNTIISKSGKPIKQGFIYWCATVLKSGVDNGYFEIVRRNGGKK